MFDSTDKLLLGLATGIVFGVLLQKGQVAKFPVIVGQFLLRDWTVVKIMGTAVIVGAVGVFFLVDAGQANLHIKPLLLGGVLLGGVLFGFGLTLLGYCPGTSVAACGEGRRDAMAGVAGMFAGALVYVAVWPALQPIVHSLGNEGKLTLHQLTDASPWLWVTGLGVAGIVGFILLRQRGKRRVPDTSSAQERVRVGTSA